MQQTRIREQPGFKLGWKPDESKKSRNVGLENNAIYSSY